MSIARNITVPLTTRNIGRAAKILTEGGIVAFPTETVYGLGVDVRNDGAVAALRQLKKRDGNKPLQVMVASLNQAKELAEFSAVAETIADNFLPGPVTLVLPQKENTPLAENVNNGNTTIGIRIPDYGPVLEILQNTGFPIAATSANISGDPTASSGMEISKLFPDGKIDLILDITLPEASIASTVIDCSGPEIRIIREGQVARENIIQLGIDVLE